MAKEHIFKVLKGEVDKQNKAAQAPKRKPENGENAAPAAAGEAAQPEDGQPEKPAKRTRAKKWSWKEVVGKQWIFFAEWKLCKIHCVHLPAVMPAGVC